MNGELFVGICRQFAGRMNETLGELTGDERRMAAGRRTRISGKAQQSSGIMKDESARQMKDFLQRNRNWNFQDERENAKAIQCSTQSPSS